MPLKYLILHFLIQEWFLSMNFLVIINLLLVQSAETETFEQWRCPIITLIGRLLDSEEVVTLNNLKLVFTNSGEMFSKMSETAVFHSHQHLIATFTCYSRRHFKFLRWKLNYLNNISMKLLIKFVTTDAPLVNSL